MRIEAGKWVFFRYMHYIFETMQIFAKSITFFLYIFHQTNWYQSDLSRISVFRDITIWNLPRRNICRNEAVLHESLLFWTNFKSFISKTIFIGGNFNINMFGKKYGKVLVVFCKILHIFEDIVQGAKNAPFSALATPN